MTKRKFDKIKNDNAPITKRIKHLDNNILALDDTLKYDFMTSLHNITIAKVITYLWMHGTIQAQIINLFHNGLKPGQSSFDARDKWPQVLNHVVTTIVELSLAKPITKTLTDIVPLIGNVILNWISYHDEHIFSTSEYSEYMAVDYLNNIKWTARGKIDYQQTAKNILAKEDNGLRDDHKYKLACTYCLEEEIAILAPKVINQDFTSYLNLVNIDIHPMVYFWTCHIMGDYTKFYNPSYYYHHYRRCSNDTSINEHIFQLLLQFRRTCNEVPIEYMWDQLSEEEKTRNIISIIEKLDNQDLRYSLLSKMNYIQQREVFKDCAELILGDMFDDWLWGKYFLPTALHILDIMHPRSYSSILDEVIQAIHNNSQEDNEYVYNHYKSMFKKLWSEAPKHLKLHGLQIYSFSWERDMDVIELILNDLTVLQKQEIIFSDSAISRCSDFIKNNQWDLLHLFIKHTLFCEEDIVQFKQKLIKVKGYAIAEYFLKQKELDKIEYFMSWALQSDEKINQFRQDLAYVKYENTLEAIITYNKVDLTDLESHFRWCASDNIEIINQFKSEIPKLYSAKTLICKLIELDKYELLDQFLNWCFLNNDQQIVQFKSSMSQDDYLPSFIREILYILIEKDNSCRLLEKFVDWCFPDQNNVQEFKYWILYPQTRYCSVCTDLLCEDQLELADKLIKWCLTSRKEVNKFKQKLMLTSDMEYTIDPARSDTQERLQLVIKWFNPTKQTIAEFKQLFPQTACPDDFYKLLDEFIESNKNIVTNSQEGLIQESQINGNNQNYLDHHSQNESTIAIVGQKGINHLDYPSEDNFMT